MGHLVACDKGVLFFLKLLSWKCYLKTLQIERAGIQLLVWEIVASFSSPFVCNLKKKKTDEYYMMCRISQQTIAAGFSTFLLLSRRDGECRMLL